jgi:hypothetical protein
MGARFRVNAEGSRATLAPVGESKPTSRKKRIGWFEQARYKLACLLFPFKAHVPPNGATPAEAVTSFLNTMIANAARTSPAWVKLFEGGLEDCGIGLEARREYFERQPVEDYYFAGTVAMEAARIRNLFLPREADAIMGEIGFQVDAAAGRRDRAVSELVFAIIGRINLSQGASLQKMPYDRVTKAVLEELGIRDDERTEPLMFDKAFRHALGEPLAIGFRNWWAAFQDTFVIYIPPEPEPEEADEDEVPVVTKSMPVKLPWRPKRATTF